MAVNNLIAALNKSQPKSPFEISNRYSKALRELADIFQTSLKLTKATKDAPQITHTPTNP